MKKIIINIGISFLICFIVLFYYSIPKITVEFADIQVYKYNFDKNNTPQMFLLDDELIKLISDDKIPLKVIVLSCRFSNQSIKKMGANLYYAKEQDLPNIILGQKLGSWMRAESLNIKSFEKNVPYKYAILVKDEGYNDNDLIKILKKVKLVIVSGEKITSKPFEINENICQDEKVKGT